MGLSHKSKKLRKEVLLKEIQNNGYHLASINPPKNEISAESTRVKHKDLEDMVHRVELTYDEIVVILDVNYTAGSTSQ